MRSSRYARKWRRGSAVLSVILGWIVVASLSVLVVQELRKEQMERWMAGVALEVATLMDRFDQAVHVVRNDVSHAQYRNLAGSDATAVFAASAITPEMQMETDPARWYGSDSVVWESGPSADILSLTFHTYNSDIYGVVAGVGVIDTGSLSAAQENWFLEKLTLKHGGSVEEIHRATEEFTALAGVLSDQQWVVYAHWFSGLDEDFVFRQERPREFPNEIEVTLDMGGNTLWEVADVVASEQSTGTHSFSTVNVTTAVDVLGQGSATSASLTTNVAAATISLDGAARSSVTSSGSLNAPELNATGVVSAASLTETTGDDVLADVTTGRDPKDEFSRTSTASVTRNSNVGSLVASGGTLKVSNGVTMAVGASGGGLNTVDIYAPKLTINDVKVSGCTGC